MAENSISNMEQKDKKNQVEIPMDIVSGNGEVVVEQPLPAEERAADAKEKHADAERKPQDAGEKAAVKEEKPMALSGVLGNKTLEDVINREAKEEQDTSSPFSLSRTLGGVIIARAFQSQIALMLLICAFLIIYITNRYVCQKKQVEIAKIESKMVEARYKATVCTSILTEKSRESNIMHLLDQYGDSTLAVPKDPPYLIRVPNE